MTYNRERRSVILVVEDVEETRFGIERLLIASGYQVSTARDAEEAVLKAGLHRPDLILMSLGLGPTRSIAIAKQIREFSRLGEEVPVIILGAASLGEGAEVGVGFNIYLTRPDNFDQLRAFLSRLLRQLP